MPTLVTREGVELARVGTWEASTGQWTCTREQLADAARAATDPTFRPPVVKLGHTDDRFDGEPALGRVTNLRLDDDGDTLLGDLTGIPAWLDEILPVAYPSRSVEAALGVTTPDGEEYAMVLEGLALLGVTVPAIQSLADVRDLFGVNDEDEPEPEYVAAARVAAAFDATKHPRGGKGSSAGGRFVAKGSGYKSSGKSDEAGDVKKVQAKLLELGLLDSKSGKNGGQDGLFGPKTDAAVKQWQRQQGMKATGKLSTADVAKLLTSKKSGTKSPARKTAAPARKAPAGRAPAKKAPAGKPTKTAPPTPGRRARKVKASASMDELQAAFRQWTGSDATAKAAGIPPYAWVRELWTDALIVDTEGPDYGLWRVPWTEDGTTFTFGEPEAVRRVYEPVTTGTKLAAMSAGQPVLASVRGRGSDVPADSQEQSVDLTRLRKRLGLSEDVPEDEVIRLAEERIPDEPADEPDEQEGDAGSAPSDSPNTDVERLVEQRVAAAMKTVEQTYGSKLESLSGELAQRKAAELSARKETLLASARRDGKIRPADVEEWSTDFDKDPDLTERALQRIAAGSAVPVAAAGVTGADDSGQDDEYAAMERALFGGGR